MSAAQHFTARSLKFLTDLSENNSREWFMPRKADYESHVRAPFLALIEAMQPALASISPHFRADPKPIGGSLFRIYRDARFSSDKSPYKPWAGARFFHERSKQTPAPSFYLHIAPGDCFVGGGLWHPDPLTQRKIRAFIAENPSSWVQATQSKKFTSLFSLGGDSLTRPPRGFDAANPLIADIKRKDFVCVRPLSDAQVCHSGLLQQLALCYQGCAPLVDYLCAALDLEF
jgi:uncharacterized protein (TIGR02453 family)